MTVKDAIAHVVAGADLTEEEMYAVITDLMDGQATPAQIGALLTALHIKGETVAEISGAAGAMRAMATPVRPGCAVIDTCGTGGDGCHTFNISTCAAFVVAAAGLCVAKHGNRAMSGTVGGADVLETLGARIELSPQQVTYCMQEVGFGFLLAPAFHRAMRHAVGPRREVGIRTIFNILGPLTNPAGAQYQLIGVFDQRWVQPLAAALGRLGCQHGLVVHGEDGLDEVSLSGPTQVAEWRPQGVQTYSINPPDYGFPCRPLTALQVSSAQESADIIRSVLAGTPGPHRDVVLLNAGAALYAGNAAASLGGGIALARTTVDSGAAARTLERFIPLTHGETV
jgi:anthranilate phosphoribosyltransferase